MIQCGLEIKRDTRRNLSTCFPPRSTPSANAVLDPIGRWPAQTQSSFSTCWRSGTILHWRRACPASSLVVAAEAAATAADPAEVRPEPTVPPRLVGALRQAARAASAAAQHQRTTAGQRRSQVVAGRSCGRMRPEVEKAAGQQQRTPRKHIDTQLQKQAGSRALRPGTADHCRRQISRRSRSGWVWVRT